MPPVVQQTTSQPVQEVQRDRSSAKILPDSPIPETSLIYSKEYSNDSRNSCYHTLFSARDLPASMNKGGTPRVGVVEVPSDLDTKAKDSLLGSNAIVAAAVRGYCEDLKQGSEIKIALVAQANSAEQKDKPNFSVIKPENITKIMHEAFGEALDPAFKQEGHVITFSVKTKMGPASVQVLLYSSDTPNGGGLVSLAKQINPTAMIVLGNTSTAMHRLQIAAENPATAADPRIGTAISNDSIVSAIRRGVKEELAGQVPVSGAQRVRFADLANNVEKFELLQNAFKSGYRFVAEEKDGKQIISILRMNVSGAAEDLGVKIELSTPTIATYKAFANERAEKIYEATSKLMSAEPMQIISPTGVPPVSLRGDVLKIQDLAQTPLGVVRKAAESGYTVHHLGTVKNENAEVESYQVFKTVLGKKIAIGAPIELPKQGENYLEKRDQTIANTLSQVLSNQPYELTHNGNLVSLVDRKSYPEIVKLLESGDLKLDKIEPVNRTASQSNLDLYTCSYRYRDSEGKDHIQPIVLSSNNFSIENVQSVISAITNKQTIEMMATAEVGKFYMLPVSSRPLDAAVVQEARILGYEIVDLGQKNDSRIYGLRNMTTYELVPSSGNGQFVMETGKIDMKFSLPVAALDGELSKALDSAITTDAENAKLNAQRDLRAKLNEELRNIRDTERRGIKWDSKSKQRIYDQLNNIEEAAGPSVGNRETEYLTRRKTNATIFTMVETADIRKLMENGAALIEGGDQERSRRSHTGMPYRYAEALGQILSDVAIKRGLGEEFAKQIRQADMGIYDTLSVAYLYNKDQIDAALNAGNSPEAKLDSANRFERFALAVAKLVVTKRENELDRVIAGSNTRVVGILGGENVFSAQALKTALAHYGVDPKTIHTDKDINPQGQRYTTNGLIDFAVSQDPAKGNSLIYIWGHANSDSFTHINMKKLAENIVASVRPKVSADGNMVIDLGHLSFMFEGCFVGSMGSGFYDSLEQAAKKRNLSIGTPPSMYSSVQRGEYSRNALSTEIKDIDGQQRPDVPLSLLQEAMVALPKSETGFTRRHMFQVADSLQDGFTRQASNYEFEYKQTDFPHLRLDLGQQSPVVFDSTPTPMKSLFEQIEQGMNSSEIKKENEGVIRLPVPKDQRRFSIHLSSVEVNENSNVS